MAEELGERTEEPTTRRLTEARNKGQVAKSQDLGAAVDLIAATIAIVAIGGFLLRGFAVILEAALGHELFGPSVRAGNVMEVVNWIGARTVTMVLPFVLISFVVAFLMQVAQVGVNLTTSQLEPKLNKLSPIAGVKRLFSVRTLMKTGMSLVKVTLVMGLVALMAVAKYEQISGIARLEVVAAFVLIGKMVLELAIVILALLLALGLLDFAYQKWQHKKDLKMTKQQVKDELKSMEGDPKIKAQRRKIAMEMATQRLRQDVPGADVIVTNPTHFSVAIKYDSETMHAPVVVAKGADYLAFRIREIGAAHNIPIVEKPPLARALYAQVKVGQVVDTEFYEAVAEILAYVYRLDGRAA